MSQIVYRVIKGQALTWLEEDNNFRYLDAKIDAVSASIPSIPSVIPPTMGGTGMAQTLPDNNRIIITSSGTMIPHAAIAANKAIVSSSVGLPEASSTTAEQIAFLNTTTSDVQVQINAKYAIPTGTTSEYIRGDGSVATFPTGLPPGGSAGGDLTGTYPNPLIGTNKVTYAKFQQVAARSIVGNPTATALANVQTITAGTDFNILRRSGTTIAFGTIDLSQIGAIGTSILSPANGGTGIPSYVIGDIIYASGATTLSRLADVATGNALISGGVATAPLWGKIGLTTHVSGILPGANGGTGVANTGKTITIGGNFTMSGGFTFTGTLTGNTSVTFPTSGTLATTAGIATTYVPYVGAIADVDLGSFKINASLFNEVAISLGAQATNIAVGTGALVSNAGTTENSIAIGLNAMTSMNGGLDNTVIGVGTLDSSVTGNGNSVFGSGGFSNSTGSYNSGFGVAVGNTITTADHVTLFGADSGHGITTGTGNLQFGEQTDGMTPISLGITTGTYNTIIGSRITGLSTTTSNNIILADGQGNIRIRWDGTNTYMGTSGKVLLGTTTAIGGNSSFFQVKGSTYISDSIAGVTGLFSGLKNTSTSGYCTSYVENNDGSASWSATAYGTLYSPAGILDQPSTTVINSPNTTTWFLGNNGLTWYQGTTGSPSSRFAITSGGNIQMSGSEWVYDRSTKTVTQNATVAAAGVSYFLSNSSTSGFAQLFQSGQGGGAFTVTTYGSAFATSGLQIAGSTYIQTDVPTNWLIGSNTLAFWSSTSARRVSMSSSGLRLGTANNNTGVLLIDAGSANTTVTVTIPAAASTWTYTLPTTAPGGNGYFMTATTGGVASWFNLLGTANTWTAAQTMDVASGGLSFLFKRGANVVASLGSGTGGSGLQGILELYHSTQVTPDIRLYTVGDSWVTGGNFGVGTKTPGALLHVAGNGLFDGTVKTGAPAASAAGALKLGVVVAGVVSPDGLNYLAAEINGTPVKLIIAA